MLTVREVRDGDWDAIAYLASNEVQEGDHSGGIDGPWIATRRSKDRQSRLAVAEREGSIVGFCAIERTEDEPSDLYRVFIVTDWSTGSREVPEKMLSHVDTLLREVGAAKAWMREVSSDRALVQFAIDSGFAASAPYPYSDKELINLARDCPPLGPQRELT
ncbi:MAG: hypothetical protein AAEJ52_06000 [Myxococcota bacterium]